MSDRVFENSRYWVVSEGKIVVEFSLSDPEGERKVILTVDNVDEHEINGIAFTAEEATLLKEFLIRKGY
jgi:hypothetical protein